MRFPEGMRTQYFKRTIVEEYAPYFSDDGEVTRIMRNKDFNYSDLLTVEDRFENRMDKLYRSVHDIKTNMITDYHNRGREDKVISKPCNIQGVSK